MSFSAGEIISIQDSSKARQALLAGKMNGGENLVLMLSDSAASEWSTSLKPKDLETGELPEGFSIQANDPKMIPDTEIIKSHGKVKREVLETVLRKFSRLSSKIYYNHSSTKPRTQNIPVSGKVLDEYDLYNMVDASLDMWLTTGRFNEQFEEKLRSYLGVRYAISVNSGSSANLLALTILTSPKLGAKQLKEGDEVITVAVGFPTTINPIIQNRLVPVFLDIELGTYEIDIAQLEESITKKTKAIMIAHTMGNAFNIKAVKSVADRYGLWLIEDNCDALGAKYDGKYTGSYGHLATLSFYPAHHITMGEGGAVIINDPKLYKIALSYRDWGRDCWCETGKDNTCGKRFDWKLGNLPSGYDHKYIYSHIGYNLKITDWQAAIGLSQMEKLPWFIQRRKENFDRLYQGLKKYEKFLILPKATANCEPSWFGFLLTVKEVSGIKKVDLVQHLEKNKIGTRQLFSGNILRQPAYLDQSCNIRIRNSELLDSANLKEEHYKLLPVADEVMKNTFWVGVGPLLNNEMIDTIIRHFDGFFNSKN